MNAPQPADASNKPSRETRDAAGGAVVRVVPRGAWFVAAGLALLIGVTVVWSIFGTISTSVVSDGVLIRRSGLETAVSGAEGRVQRLLVSIDDQVEVGDPILELRQPELELELRALETKLAELQRRKSQTEALHARSREAVAVVVAQRQAALEAQLAAAREDAVVNKELADGRKQLLDRGNTTRASYLEVYRLYTEANVRAASVESQIAALQSETLENDRRNWREMTDIDAQLAETAFAIDGLKERIARNSIVRSAHAGRVVELKSSVGDLVTLGASLATIERAPGPDDALELILYPTIDDGKKIESGMAARVTPSTVKREESGYIHAEITFVSDYTASRDGMMRRLQSDSLVEQFSRRGPPMEARAKLFRREGGVLDWSTRRADTPIVSSGTPASVEVVVTRQRPISLVIPLLKRSFGVE